MVKSIDARQAGSAGVGQFLSARAISPALSGCWMASASWWIAVRVAVRADDNAVSGIRISKNKEKRLAFSRIVDSMPQSAGSGRKAMKRRR